MRYKGYVYLIITILLFSTIEVVSSTLKGLIDPFQLTFLRFIVGGLTLLPFVLFSREKVTPKDFLFFLGLGILNVLISMGCYQLAIVMGKASTVAILISSNPVFVALFSMLILKEKITKNGVVCILLGILGISLIIYKGDSGGDTIEGLILALLASVTFALYTVLGKFKTDNVSSVTMICWSSILGSLLYIPVLMYKKLPLFYMPQGSVLKVLYLGIFVSGIAYVTYMKALKDLSASKGSMVFFLKPAIATVLAVIFLHETVRLNTILGMCLVLLGIAANFINFKHLETGDAIVEKQ